MSEPFLAEVRMVGFNFAPRGWAQCDGQILPIAQNQALYSLLGTNYGGDGRTSFGLPELRGRTPFHPSSNMRLGSKGGFESVTLNSAELPPHSHTLYCSEDAGSSVTPESNYPAESTVGDLQYATAGGSSTVGAATGTEGADQAHENMAPFAVVNFVIAITGLFPSRS